MLCSSGPGGDHCILVSSFETMVEMVSNLEHKKSLPRGPSLGSTIGEAYSLCAASPRQVEF